MIINGKVYISLNKFISLKFVFLKSVFFFLKYLLHYAYDIIYIIYNDSISPIPSKLIID